MTNLNSDNLRILKGRLIATLATKLTEQAVDFNGITVHDGSHWRTWKVRVEFEQDPMTLAQMVEHYQQVIPIESLEYDLEPLMNLMAKHVRGMRNEWLARRT